MILKGTVSCVVGIHKQEPEYERLLFRRNKKLEHIPRKKGEPDVVKIISL